jgi:glycosyltransferase involved in cell wall biosynthesis
MTTACRQTGFRISDAEPINNRLYKIVSFEKHKPAVSAQTAACATVTMKITLINTYQSSGGAAVACRRLFRALRKQHTEATFLVQSQSENEPFTAAVAANAWQKKAAFARFTAERLYFWFFEKSRKFRFAFSPANVGTDISQHPAVGQADVLHLHWINFGFLSIGSLEKLVALKKPIVWTLHDMWAFTGGCHYSGGCTRYLSHCQHCPFLKNPSVNDLSYRVFEKKKILFQNANVRKNLHFVACSQWLADVAKQSELLKGFPITSIPNPIDTQVYRPLDKCEIRRRLGLSPDRKLILFGAMNTQDPRKGFVYLERALHWLHENNANLKDKAELVIFGKADPETLARLPFGVRDYGSVKGDEALADLYNACDVMVLPSLEDNLPNTVMEALACGTPAVAFRTGGLPELIEHQQNGYLAEYGSAEDLAVGIGYVLDENRHETLAVNARASVVRRFSEGVVAAQYRALYANLSSKS